MTAQWYVFHSKPMKEDLLWGQLRLHEIEGYYPRIRVQPTNPRARKIKAYFPGYVFGRVDLQETNLSILQWIPGSTGIVSFDGMPAHVPDNLVEAIRRRVDQINEAGGELFVELRSGDVVTIQDGPFRGYEAVFDARLSGNERVRVFLKLLSRQQVALELPGRQIQRKKQ